MTAIVGSSWSQSSLCGQEISFYVLYGCLPGLGQLYSQKRTPSWRLSRNCFSWLMSRSYSSSVHFLLGIICGVAERDGVIWLSCEWATATMPNEGWFRIFVTLGRQSADSSLQFSAPRWRTFYHSCSLALSVYSPIKEAVYLTFESPLVYWPRQNCPKSPVFSNLSQNFEVNLFLQEKIFSWKVSSIFETTFYLWTQVLSRKNCGSFATTRVGISNSSEELFGKIQSEFFSNIRSENTHERLHFLIF